MGVGETSVIDERGRITIPSEIRKTIGRKEFKVELLDKDTIILKAVEPRDDKIRKIQEITLTGDPEKALTDFSTVKDRYGGRHVEDT